MQNVWQRTCIAVAVFKLDNVVVDFHPKRFLFIANRHTLKIFYVFVLCFPSMLEYYNIVEVNGHLQIYFIFSKHLTFDDLNFLWYNSELMSCVYMTLII